MKNRYKIILSNRKIYKEIEMPMEVPKLVIGTDIHCDVRLRKEIFFEQFELVFKYEKDIWQIICSENVYVTADNIFKLLTKDLSHGDELQLKYQESDADILKISFMIDFEFEKNDYERCIDISDVDELYIGGTEKCQIYLNNPYINKDYVVMRKQKGGYVLEERGTKYGVYVNDTKRTGKITLKNGDFIALANYSFYLKGHHLYTSKKSNAVVNGLKVYDVAKSRNQMKYPMFNRNTRIKSVIETEKIEVQDPSAAPQKPKGNIVLQLMPAIAMLAVTVVLRGAMSNSSNNSFIILSACTMSIGILTSVMSIISDRKSYKKNVEQRIEKYNTYISKKEQEIQKYRAEEAQILEDRYYSLEKEIKMVDDFSPDLFNRDLNDEDYLQIRLGTGVNEAQRKVEFKKQEKYDCEDELIRVPENIAEKYKEIANTPTTLGLKEKNSIGIIGNRKNLYGMLKNITLDLAIRHYYTDVNMFYIIDEERKNQFRWIRLLPHVKNAELGNRNIVCDLTSKNVLFEYLYKELSRRMVSKEHQPSIVVFVYDDMGIKKHPISNFLNKSAELNIYFLFFEKYMELLPNGCSDIVLLQDEGIGHILSTADDTKKKEFTYNVISDVVADRIVQKLAPVYCEEVSLEGSLTKNITLFELFDILSVDDIKLEENWKNSQVYKTMAAPLGVNAKNEIVYLDLNEKNHGPHGLVAGTTGSGKSEILQTFILSVATLFHPYEIAFMIIDFKGGGMVNQFKDLPHLLGAITNIDGKEIDRSLKSIKAELQKRQRWFAEAEVNHIDKYIRKYKEGEVSNPLPHLIIVVDEFAELKAEQPEFMKELISAARIGRSLGVHLILATQKPAGVVDAQIWSNSKFKLCLKVQSKEDSNEVIKTPLAAEIKEPGRAYLQVGNNEIFELFQSAYSGAPAVMDDSSGSKEFVISGLNLSGARKVVYQQKKTKENTGNSKNQLEAMVDYIADYCEKVNLMKLPNICMPPLPEMIPYEASEKRRSEEIFATIGMLDNPEQQLQEKLSINITAQNTMLIGSAQTGKTNVLQTIIRSLADNYTSEEVNMYIMDFGSMILRNFAELNHCGGVVCSYEDEKVKSLFRLLNKELNDRKSILSKAGVSSFSSYKEAGNYDLSQIVVIIDNFTALKELYLQEDDQLLPLCRDGNSVGISVIISNAQTAGIGYKYLNNFEGRIALFCNETSEYSMLFEGNRLKVSNIPGRALVQIAKTVLECQAYIAFQGEKEYERVQQMRKFVDIRNMECVGTKAKVIPVIPDTLTTAYVEANYKSVNNVNQIMLGLNYETIMPSVMELNEKGMLALCGKKDCGKDLFAKYFINTLLNKSSMNTELYIVDGIAAKWSEFEFEQCTAIYTTTNDSVAGMITELHQRAEERYEALATRKMDNLDNEPWLILVVENVEAIVAACTEKSVASMVKNLLGKFNGMKVFILVTNLDNTAIAFNAPEFLKLIKENKRYLIFDEISNIKVTDISISLTRKYAKPLEKQDAYYIEDNNLLKLRTVM